jgi:hypothetical protein
MLHLIGLDEISVLLELRIDFELVQKGLDYMLDAVTQCCEGFLLFPSQGIDLFSRLRLAVSKSIENQNGKERT